MKLFSKIFYPLYFLLLLVSYFTYAFLENYRIMDRSQYWQSKSSLSSKDVAEIHQLGRTVNLTEWLFMSLFAVSLVLIIAVNRKNVSGMLTFLIYNAAGIAGIVGIGYVIHLATSLPMGNLLQPLIPPISMLIFLFVYVLLKMKWRRSSVSNM